MNDLRDDLKAYLDGELDAERAQTIAAALETDPELAQEAAFMKALGFEIKRIAVEPSVEGRAVAIERARVKRTWWGGLSLMQRVGYACAGAFCLLVGASMLFPIMAQSKESAKAMQGYADSAKASGDMESSGAATAPATEAPAPSADMSAERARIGAGGGAPARDQANGYLNGRTLDGVASKAKAQSSTVVPMKGASRLVVKNATLTTRVESVSKAMAASGTIAESFGGFVINSQSSDLKGEEASGTVTLRVPSSRFDAAMTKLRALGEVTNESSSGDDVTSQVADIGARLKVLRAEEDSYVTMLRGARRVGEMLEIKERLSGVRQEIESLTAQVASLKDLAAMSTITATFEQKTQPKKPLEEPESGFGETWTGAVNGLQSALRFLGSVLIVVFVYAPIWLPIVGLIWWLNKRSKRQ